MVLRAETPLRLWESACRNSLSLFSSGLMATVEDDMDTYPSAPWWLWLARPHAWSDVVAMLMVNNIRDIPTVALREKTVAVRLGQRASRILFSCAYWPYLRLLALPQRSAPCHHLHFGVACVDSGDLPAGYLVLSGVKERTSSLSSSTPAFNLGVGALRRALDLKYICLVTALNSNHGTYSVHRRMVRRIDLAISDWATTPADRCR